MADTLAFIVKNARTAGGDHQINKALADFDFDSQRRLGRTRMLVRAGPALGLMGTLIPLSPALTGLANGNTTALSENLRVAFSVTVVGPARRCGRVRDLAFSRPHVRSGPLGPRVRRGDRQRLRSRWARQRPCGDPAERRDSRLDSMISVTPRARSREDRAGDPLDGLVNLFDLGIVLSVAFLLAALSSLHLGGAITRHGLKATAVKQIRSSPGKRWRRCPSRVPRRSAAARRPASSTGWPTANSSTSRGRPRRRAGEWVISGMSSPARSR